MAPWLRMRGGEGQGGESQATAEHSPSPRPMELDSWVRLHPGQFLHPSPPGQAPPGAVRAASLEHLDDWGNHGHAAVGHPGALAVAVVRAMELIEHAPEQGDPKRQSCGQAHGWGAAPGLSPCAPMALEKPPVAKPHGALCAVEAELWSSAYVCLHVYTCMYVCACICLCVCACMHVCKCMPLHPIPTLPLPRQHDQQPQGNPGQGATEPPGHCQLPTLPTPPKRLWLWPRTPVPAETQRGAGSGPMLLPTRSALAAPWPDTPDKSPSSGGCRGS